MPLTFLPVVCLFNLSANVLKIMKLNIIKKWRAQPLRSSLGITCASAGIPVQLKKAEMNKN